MARLRATFLQGFLIGLGGAAFALFGCLGAVAGFSSNDTTANTLGWAGILAAIVGLLVFFVGAVLFIIATFKAIFGKRDGIS